MENPYAPALAWIRKDKTSGSATGLAKLILSLWNDAAAYSLRECVAPFDDDRLAWAETMVSHFLRHGEDRFLTDAGKEVYGLRPDLWEIGQAGDKGKQTAIRDRERQRETLSLKRPADHPTQHLG